MPAPGSRGNLPVVLVPGDVVAGRYRVLSTLGQGGLGTVYRVEDVRRARALVLKVLRHQHPELLEVLRNEFALLMSVSHPHLLSVHDYGAARVRGEVVHFYTAEWIEGSTVAERAPFGSTRQLLQPVLDAVMGLGALHRFGLRHGDFKPDNVLVRPDGSGVLIDLSCAAPFGRVTVPRGTREFMAPELLDGDDADQRADFYSVGVALEKLLADSAVTVEPSVTTLVERLLAASPQDRVQSADELFEALSWEHRQRERRALVPRELIERADALGAFVSWLAKVEEGQPAARTLVLTGPPGVGLTRMLRECVWRAQLALPVVRVHAAEGSAFSWLLTHALAGQRFEPSIPRVIDAALALAGGEPRLLVVEDVEELEPDELEWLLAFARSLPDTSQLGLLLSSNAELAIATSETLKLEPLSLEGVRQWTRQALSQRRLQELWESTRGLPAELTFTLQAGLATAAIPSTHGAAQLPAALTRALESLPHSERDALLLVTVLGGELDPRRWGLGEHQLQQAFELGLLERASERVRLRSTRYASVLEEYFGVDALRAAHAHAAEILARSLAPRVDGVPLEHGSAAALQAAEFVAHTALAGDEAGAEAELVKRKAQWLLFPQAYAKHLRAVLPGSKSAAMLLLSSELFLHSGDWERTLACAAGVLRLRAASELQRRARLMAADALLRLGRARRAVRVLAPLLASTTPDTDRTLALERCARARLQQGEHQAAYDAACEGLSCQTTDETRAALSESKGLAASYLGRQDEALACFTALVEPGTRTLSPRQHCRLLGQAGILAFRGGGARLAFGFHEQALDIAEKAGLDDLVAVGCLNLGTTEQQMGALGQALQHFERGLSVTRALGRLSTELVLRFNLANLYALIGDSEQARAEGRQLERRSHAQAARQFTGPLLLLEAELLQLERQHDRARETLARASAVFEARGLERERAEVELCGAELDLATGAPTEGRRRARAARTQAQTLQARDLEARAAMIEGRACVALQERDGIASLEAALKLAQEASQRTLEAQITHELALAQQVFHEPDAAACGIRAQLLWGELAAHLPEPLRRRFWADPRRARASEQVHETQASQPDTALEKEALYRLLALTRRVNSSLTLDKVLDDAVDAAVDLTGAERGFLLLLGAQGELTVRASREGAEPGTRPSQSIVLRALETQEPVLTTDAQEDTRFGRQGSVHALRLKSVLCVPVSTPAATLGILYVDSRLQHVRFAERHRELLVALADQVAVAVSNASLHTELERRSEELQAQKRTIEQLSQTKDRELERLREELEVSRQALGLRYDYSNIIGRGPKMRAVLEHLDRVIESAATVLIQGESGTGKELIARAIHVHGPRQAGPFVGINCAALPETLLESELFGHARGAFTGADRDKKGLLFAADGGTLFLDEIAEIPLATQAKLLRVLQEREARPLGATRSAPFDVRVVAASHKDLALAVSEGSFREDLYYRLAVVVVQLPPLRERPEDLPELCLKILERLASEAGREAPTLSADALRALASHAFPGNVRELENVLTRAFVLHKKGSLRAADLEIHSRAKKHRTLHSTSRRDFEREERTRIFEALQSTRWNVSLVSRSLAIPRNTLYRKLKQYGLTSPEGRAPGKGKTRLS